MDIIIQLYRLNELNPKAFSPYDTNFIAKLTENCNEIIVNARKISSCVNSKLERVHANHKIMNQIKKVQFSQFKLFLTDKSVKKS